MHLSVNKKITYRFINMQSRERDIDKLSSKQKEGQQENDIEIVTAFQRAHYLRNLHTAVFIDVFIDRHSLYRVAVDMACRV